MSGTGIARAGNGSTPAVVGVIGDFTPANVTHRLTCSALEQLGLAYEWRATDAVGDEPARALEPYAGLWIAPASPYRSMDGALAAIRHARERGVPLVGT